MKKVLLLLLPFLLGSCTAVPRDEETNAPSTPSTQEEQHQEIPTEQEEHTQGGGTQTEEEHTQGEGTGTGGGTETGGEGTGTGGGTTPDVEHQDNDAISLDEWQHYEFHDGHKPAWNDDWDFYFGDTYKPVSSCFYECPNEDLDYSGIKFSDKKQYLVSPNFVSYPKVEVRFQFWLSGKSSSKYKATANEPQFKIQEYDSSNNLINTENFELSKRDVHNDNTPTEKTFYILQNQMTHFAFRFNNFIPNGDTGYMPVLCKISLKGWPRV